MTLEHDVEFEGVGAHRLNPRFDFIEGEHEVVASRQMLMTPRLVLFRALAGSYRDDGHDGSHWQYDHGDVDFNALSQHVWWLAWKATQSTTYKDPTFDRVQAEANRFEQFVSYHWLSPSADPEQQAAWYMQCRGEVPPGHNGMGDIEEAGNTVDHVLAFYEYVEARQRKSMIHYTGLYVSGGTMWDDQRLWEGKYGLRPFIVAAYVTEANLNARLGTRRRWDGWQFSSDGPMPGITGRADRDRIDDKEVFSLACGAITTRKETDMLIRGTPGGPHNDFRGDYSLGFVTNMGGDFAALGFTGNEGIIVSDAWLDAKLALGLPQGPKGKDGIDGTDGIDGIDGTDGIDGKDGKDAADSGSKNISLTGTMNAGVINLTGTAT